MKTNRAPFDFIQSDHILSEKNEWIRNWLSYEIDGIPRLRFFIYELKRACAQQKQMNYMQ